MEEKTMQRVRQLLAEAGRAHHDYEEREPQAVGNHDWSDWYASYCVAHGLPDVVGREIREDELADILRACDSDYRRDQPPEAWPDYYATRILGAR